MADKILNILFATEEQPEVIPEDFEKVVCNPLSIVDLIKEVPKKKVSEP